MSDHLGAVVVLGDVDALFEDQVDPAGGRLGGVFHAFVGTPSDGQARVEHVLFDDGSVRDAGDGAHARAVGHVHRSDRGLMAATEEERKRA